MRSRQAAAFESEKNRAVLALGLEELGAASEAFGTNVVADSDRAASGIARQFSAIVDEQDWRR